MGRLRVFAIVAVLLALPACARNPRSSSQTRSTSLIDLNSATVAQLQRLPGITEIYARRIVANRPYKVKHELETRKILPSRIYARIRDRVTAIERIPDL
jgi:DNA uptake protein ComE-like DNA-binding protein